MLLDDKLPLREKSLKTIGLGFNRNEEVIESGIIPLEHSNFNMIIIRNYGDWYTFEKWLEFANYFYEIFKDRYGVPEEFKRAFETGDKKE